MIPHVLLSLPDGIFPEVEDRSSEHSVSLPDLDAVDQVLKIANAPEAIIGISTALLTVAVSSRSNPF